MKKLISVSIETKNVLKTMVNPCGFKFILEKIACNEIPENWSDQYSNEIFSFCCDELEKRIGATEMTEYHKKLSNIFLGI